MRRKHQVFAFFLCILTATLAGYKAVRLDAEIIYVLLNVTAISFGFYLVTIGILYHSGFVRQLHEYIDDRLHKRGTHIFRDYFIISGEASIYFMGGCVLFLLSGLTTHPLLSVIGSAVLLGLFVRNLFYLLLAMHTLVHGLVDEGKL